MHPNLFKTSLAIIILVLIASFGLTTLLFSQETKSGTSGEIVISKQADTSKNARKETAKKTVSQKKEAGSNEKTISKEPKETPKVKEKTKSEDVKYVNKRTASALIEEGKALYSAGDYEGALKKYEEAKLLEPNNLRIVELKKEVKEAQMNIDLIKATADRELTERERLIEIQEQWSTKPTDTEETPESPKKKFSLEEIEKKARMKLSACDFDNANVRDVINYLADLSGINIVLDETVLSSPMNVTVHLKNFTVLDALEVVLRTKGLGYRLEENLIWISNIENLSKENLETRIYHLSHGLASLTTFTTFDTVTTPAGIKANEPGVSGIPATSTLSTVSTLQGTAPPASDVAMLPAMTVIPTIEGVKIGGAGGVSGQVTVTIKEILLSCVTWPDGSRIFLDNRTSILIIRNTPSNHTIIEKILGELDVTPLQIMIEAKFVEIFATDLKNLGIKWTPQISGSGAARPTTFPFERSTSGGDFLPLSKPGSTSNTDFAADARADFKYASATDFTFGILDFSQFQAVMYAIESDARNNLLSAPKVTTINGQEAVIKVVREYIYPTSYSTTAAEYNAAGVKVKESTSTPGNFKTRDIGIILRVTPTVGKDKKTINLTLTPEVSELGEWKNYGTTTVPYEQPLFDSRRCTTSLVVNNGDTIVMGGLIKENQAKEKNKVPLLGDIPLVGLIFTRTYDKKEKKNLVVFVTAHILPPKENLKNL